MSFWFWNSSGPSVELEFNKEMKTCIIKRRQTTGSPETGSTLHLQQFPGPCSTGNVEGLCPKALCSQLHVSRWARWCFSLYRSCQFTLLNCPLPSSPTFYCSWGGNQGIHWFVRISHLSCALGASCIEFLCISWLPYLLILRHVFRCLVFCGRNHLFAVKNS